MLAANSFVFSVLLFAGSGIARYGSIGPETSLTEIEIGAAPTGGAGPNCSRLFILNGIRHGSVLPDGRESGAASAPVPRACMKRPGAGRKRGIRDQIIV